MFLLEEYRYYRPQVPASGPPSHMATSATLGKVADTAKNLKHLITHIGRKSEHSWEFFYLLEGEEGTVVRTNVCQKHKLEIFKQVLKLSHIRNNRHKGGQMSSLLFWLFLHSISVTGGLYYLFWPSLFILAVTICSSRHYLLIYWMENQPK